MTPEWIMSTVFLSYSKNDYFFAELLEIKLSEAGITLWRDQGQLRAGMDWLQGLETGISGCLAVVVALSANSAESCYVTFEWAYALGKGKAIIPIKMNECSIHQKLAPIQYFYFTVPGASPWDGLIERIRGIETDIEPSAASAQTNVSTSISTISDTTAKAILAFLNQRGYQMASFDRLRKRIDENLENKDFLEVIAKHPTVFRSATIVGGTPEMRISLPGIAKLIP
jgi:TIR domain